MTTLWFWAAIVAAVFALAAYNQASSPGWWIGIGALLLGAVASGYLFWGFPSEMMASSEAFDRHPDSMKFNAAVYVLLAAMVCLLGALVGTVFKRLAPAGRIGLWAFVGGFVGFQMLVFSLQAME